MNTILPFAQIFVHGEKDEPDVIWGFNELKSLTITTDVPLPRIAVTGRDIACTNAAFPESDMMLCRWHVKRNVEAQDKKKISNNSKRSLAVAKFVDQFELAFN
ncbi:hypothetical protein L914_02687 [Phytophthora nicotianae]|uniref:MULE transposase domain-containing protein n=1 Tax=Phytophthora nicotianae TaxID=4792 RepID=W2NYQ0_PHYNI|nr:hypothetical protein L914_02687 [Phytophthora nicotianae]